MHSFAGSEQEAPFAGMADFLNSSPVWGKEPSALVADVAEDNDEGLAATAIARTNKSQKIVQGESADIPAKFKDFDGAQRVAGMRDREPLAIVTAIADMMLQVLLMSLLGACP